jgi:secreted trypsin-like serine protease
VPDGKYPFMAVLTIQEADGSYLCGGTLIDPNSVLTVAHCVERALNVRLAVGRTEMSQEDQGEARDALRWFIHPRYNGLVDDRYDAAVLTLDRRVTNIQPIKLATARQDGLGKPRRNLTVAGWGTTSEGGNTSDRMLEVSVPVVSDSVVLPEAHGCRGRGGQRLLPGRQRRAAVQTERPPRAGRDRELRYLVYEGRLPGVYTQVNNSGIRSFIVDAAQQ